MRERLSLDLSGSGALSKERLSLDLSGSGALSRTVAGPVPVERALYAPVLYSRGDAPRGVDGAEGGPVLSLGRERVGDLHCQTLRG